MTLQRHPGIPGFLRLIPLLALLWFTGCGGGGRAEKEGEKTITFLTMQLQPAFNDFFYALIDEFEAAHPGVTIKWLDYPFQNYETKLITSFLGGAAPDVINLGSESLRTYTRKGLFQDLEELLPPDVLDNYVQQLLEDGCRIDGTIYALPWYLSTQITLANRAIFEAAGLELEEAPLYYEELREICKTIFEKTGKYAFYPLYTEQGRLRFFLLEAGVPLLDESRTEAAFNTSRGVEILKFWTDLYKDNLVPSESLTGMHRRPVELYKTGRLGLVSMGPEFLRQIRSDAPDVYENTVVGPKMRWKEYDAVFVSMHVLAVARTAKHPELAAEWAAFVMNEENLLEFCQRAPILPGNQLALNDEFFKGTADDPIANARRIAAEQVEGARVYQPPPDKQELYEVFEDVTEAVGLGKMTAAEALEVAEEEWNRVLERQRREKGPKDED